MRETCISLGELADVMSEIQSVYKTELADIAASLDLHDESSVESASVSSDEDEYGDATMRRGKLAAKGVKAAREKVRSKLKGRRKKSPKLSRSLYSHGIKPNQERKDDRSFVHSTATIQPIVGKDDDSFSTASTFGGNGIDAAVDNFITDSGLEDLVFDNENGPEISCIPQIPTCWGTLTAHRVGPNIVLVLGEGPVDLEDSMLEYSMLEDSMEHEDSLDLASLDDSICLGQEDSMDLVSEAGYDNGVETSIASVDTLKNPNGSQIDGSPVDISIKGLSLTRVSRTEDPTLSSVVDDTTEGKAEKIELEEPRVSARQKSAEKIRLTRKQSYKLQGLRRHRSAGVSVASSNKEERTEREIEAPTTSSSNTDEESSTKFSEDKSASAVTDEESRTKINKDKSSTADRNKGRKITDGIKLLARFEAAKDPPGIVAKDGSRNIRKDKAKPSKMLVEKSEIKSSAVRFSDQTLKKTGDPNVLSDKSNHPLSSLTGIDIMDTGKENKNKSGPCRDGQQLQQESLSTKRRRKEKSLARMNTSRKAKNIIILKAKNIISPKKESPNSRSVAKSDTSTNTSDCTSDSETRAPTQEEITNVETNNNHDKAASAKEDSQTVASF